MLIQVSLVAFFSPMCGPLTYKTKKANFTSLVRSFYIYLSGWVTWFSMAAGLRTVSFL